MESNETSTVGNQQPVASADAGTGPARGGSPYQASRSSARPSLQGETAALVARQRRLRLGELAAAGRHYEQYLVSDEWVYPTTGFHISTWFGAAGSVWSSGYHTGLDMSTALGTPVVAVADATVSAAGWDGPYGNQIRIRFASGDEAWYNHLSRIDVTAGQQVVQGQTLGAVGDTGNSYGAHLHFEYRYAADLETPVDPVPIMAEHGLHL